MPNEIGAINELIFDNLSNMQQNYIYTKPGVFLHNLALNYVLCCENSDR